MHLVNIFFPLPVLLEIAWDQRGTTDVSATVCVPSAPAGAGKKKIIIKIEQTPKIQQLPFIVPLAWIEIWLITLFHIQGCALKIAVPPLGGSQGTKGEQAAEEQRRGRAFSVLINLSNAVATQVTSESTAGKRTLFRIWYRSLGRATWGWFNVHVPGQ